MFFSSGLETGAEVVKRVGNLNIDGTSNDDWLSVTNMPDRVPCPPFPTGCPDGEGGFHWVGSAKTWGYYLAKAKAIVKWNVPGGLKFVDVVD